MGKDLLSRKTLLFNALGVILTIITLWAVGSGISYEGIKNSLSSLNWEWLFPAAGAFYLNYAARAQRLRLITVFPARAPFPVWFAVASVHGALNFLLPAKTGELTFPIIARKVIGLPYEKGIAGLAVARLFDFVVVAITLPIAVFAFRGVNFNKIALGGVLYCVLVLALLCGFRLMLKIDEGFLRKQRFGSNRVSQAVLKFIGSLRDIHHQRVYIKTAFLSFSIWLMIYSNFYCLARVVGADLSFIEVVAVSAVLIPLTMIPVQGVANFGAHEIGWVLSLTLFGYDKTSAIEVAFMTHVLLLMHVLVFGFVGAALVLGSRRIGSIASDY